jgi:integrase/recombinase XerD
MVQLKIVLDTRRKKSDGTYPIIYRLTNVKKIHVLSSKVSILEEQWDADSNAIDKSHPNALALNTTLSKRFYEIQKAILHLEDEFSFDAIKEILDGKTKLQVKDLTFNEFANQVINEFLEVKRTGNAVVYRTAVKRFSDFNNNPKLRFKDITYSLLDAFIRKLMADGAKPNTIGNYLRSIRAIFNKAIKAKLVDRAHYPFNEVKIKSERTAKRAISKESLIALKNKDLQPKSKEWHARNYFLLSFNFMGISFTDMAYLKHGNIVKGRLCYKRRKTKKQYNIKVTAQASEILKYYSHTSNYLLPVLPPNVEEDSLESKKVIQQFIKTTNKWLSRLGKKCDIDNLTTYVSRHSWATTAKRLGYSNEIIAECLGHEYGNKITNIYLDNFDQSLIDEVNDRIVQLLE